MKHDVISTGAADAEEIGALDPLPPAESIAPTLTIIIPLRVTEARSDLVERVSFILSDPSLPDSASILVVDDGSPRHHFESLQKAIEGKPIDLISTGAKHYQTFSFSRARNCGAQHATGEYVLFLDADLTPYPGFFNDLYQELRHMIAGGYVNDFLMIPCLYLTEEGYKIFLQTPENERRFRFINAMLEGNSDIIEQYSTGTSAILLRRDYYLVRGGYDPKFKGWGFEDYEFICRLIRRSRQFPISHNWLRSDSNFMKIKQYEGWKAVYRLHGEWLARKGIWLFHVPHAIEKSYHVHKDANWRLFQERMKEDATNVGEPPALPDLTAGRSLFLAKNPFTYGREIAPYFGEPIFATDMEFTRVTALKQKIKQHNIDRIVFGNPYKNSSTILAYNWCRKNNFPYIICERGALPGSIFHDRSGFLTDSDNYHPKKWDRELTEDEIAVTKEYIAEIRGGDDMLEKQSNRLDPHIVRRKLGIKDHQKVLFVPFQQPKDTVIRHFSGPIGNFAAFFDLVSALPEQLGNDWVVVYKKHPVEDDLSPIPNAKAADDFNVYDLIEICDAMLLINSGTGIYGMMFGKPVYIVGDSWYADPRMNVSVEEFAKLPEIIRTDFEIDYDRVLRFIHYLRFEFYSFGEQVQRRVRYEDGSPITATTEIKYYEVRGFTPKPLRFKRKFNPIPKTSPIFERYDLDSLGFAAPAKPVAPRPNATAAPSVPKPAPKLPLASAPQKTPEQIKAAKSAKFRRDPHAFFRDAKNPLLRPLRHLVRQR